MQPHAASNPRPDGRDQDAFTITDLLGVLGVIAVLALLSVTALAHSQTSSGRAVCANNLRRLMLAWQMYADDNSGSLMAHGSTALPWISGSLSFSPSNTANTNTFYLTNASYAAIGPYVNSSTLFRCPADTTTLVFGGVPMLRVRSYSMNEYVGPISDAWSPSFQVMMKASEVSQPSRIFVLLEEHPDSINDGEFVLDLASVGSSSRFIDYPAYFHLGGINLGMADGHIEYWQWSDARTMPPITGGSISLTVPSPNNPDVARLQAAASYLK